MLLARLFPDEQYDKKSRHDTDSRATLGAGVHRIYLPAPVDAHARAEMQLGYHRVFNLILWVLYTGMQWKCMPVLRASDGTALIHYTTIYKVFAKWADGVHRQRAASGGATPP
jgi:transposase